MPFRAKNYLPRSLFGRAALILIVPIVTIQLVVSIFFIQRHFDGVTRQLSRGVMLEVGYLADEVAAADNLATAQGRAADVAAGLSMVVKLPATAPGTADLRDFWDLSGREVGTTLHEGLPNLTAVDLQTNSRVVQMWLTTRHGVMMVALPRSRVSASNPHQLLVLMLVA